jgi:hypothetical protein
MITAPEHQRCKGHQNGQHSGRSVEMLTLSTGTLAPFADNGVALSFTRTHLARVRVCRLLPKVLACFVPTELGMNGFDDCHTLPFLEHWCAAGRPMEDFGYRMDIADMVEWRQGEPPQGEHGKPSGVPRLFRSSLASPQGC